MVPCNRCKEVFDKRELVEGCTDQFLYCGACFWEMYSKATGDRSYKVPDNVRSRLLPFPQIFSYYKSTLDEKKSSKFASTTSISLKPVQCPQSSCRKCVSLFSLETHFKTEHKGIPIIIAQLEIRSALEFYPRTVAYNLTECVALINIVRYDFSTILPQTSTTTIFRKMDGKPMMLLLASKITDDVNLLDQQIMNVRTLPRESASVLSYTVDEDLISPKEKIIFWVSSDIHTGLSYTVAASTATSRIRQKYFGPILAMDDPAINIFQSGLCLMLTHYHVNGMTRQGTKPLALDVVIHSPD